MNVAQVFSINPTFSFIPNSFLSFVLLTFFWKWTASIKWKRNELLEEKSLAFEVRQKKMRMKMKRRQKTTVDSNEWDITVNLYCCYVCMNWKSKRERETAHLHRVKEEMANGSCLNVKLNFNEKTFIFRLYEGYKRKIIKISFLL
jgi:hypothetical protein